MSARLRVLITVELLSSSRATNSLYKFASKVAQGTGPLFVKVMETNPLSLSRTSTVELTACQLFRKKSSSILQDARRPCLIGILRSLDVALALIWSSIQHYPRSLHTHACVQLDALLIFFLYAIHMHVRLPKADTARFAGAGDILADRSFVSGRRAFIL